MPGSVDFITAGKLVIQRSATNEHVGRFVYGKSYLANPRAVALDPRELPLADTVFTSVFHNGLFGAMRDASPDYWGRLIIERNLEKPLPSEMDYLLNSPDDRSGALGFGLGVQAPAPLRTFNRTINLESLQAAAEAIVDDRPLQSTSLAQQVRELVLPGTSLGGARPKAVIEHKGELWIAKFNCSTDRWDNALVEHGLLKLAHNCGINTPPSEVIKVGGRSVLLVKRFDRERCDGGFLRHRMLSALTVLGADEEVTMRSRWSYVLLAEELRRLSEQPAKDCEQLFRRMAFNALVSNTDDHPRNHAVIARTGWRLSPVYDLSVTVQPSIERRDLAMSCGDLGRFANKKNLLSQHARFLLSAKDAENIVEALIDVVKFDWRKSMRSVGLSESECHTIESSFVYPGFL